MLSEVQKHKRILNNAAGALPLPVLGGKCGTELKLDMVPRRCPEPIWGHGAYRAINEKWAREGLQSEEYEHAPQCEWASRPHNVQKTKRGSAKSDPDFDVRNVGDFVYINSQCVRLQSNTPNVSYYLERASGKKAY